MDEVRIETAFEHHFDEAFKIQQALDLRDKQEFRKIDFEWVEKSWLEEKISKGQCYIAKYDGIICAVMCIDIFGEVFEIDSLAVKEGFRKKGIGRKLVEFAKELWKDSGKIILHVGTFFEYHARLFYERCGFEFDSIRSIGGCKYHRLTYAE